MFEQDRKDDVIKPISIYIHIPFCVQKCLYCDFLSNYASEEQKEKYLCALIKELEYWRVLLSNDYYVRTIFIGGGTPTCLSAEQLLRIGEQIKQFPIKKEELEFTIEANPGTITPKHIEVFQKIGVNRVSLGLQSAQNNELNALGRIHSYEEFVRSFKLLQDKNIFNINVDLMSDIPNQTLDSYKDTLLKVIQLKPTHISSYSLIIEEGTAFYEMAQNGQLQIPNEETDRQMYKMTQEILEEYGYKRYEISNYALKNKECQHNLVYWKMKEYIGIGLGASSYFNGFRFNHVRNIQQYCKKMDEIEYEKRNKLSNITEDTCIQNSIQKQRLQYIKKMDTFHEQSLKDEMEEFVFLGLRTMDGISQKEYEKRFHRKMKDVYSKQLPLFLKNKLLAEDKNHDRIYLTNRGIDISNAILSEFLLDEE